MKKFLIFILTLVLLIVSEYFFISELFARKRGDVILLSLAATVLCIYGVIKFFKKYILPAKTLEGQG